MARSETEPEARMYWTLTRQLRLLARANMAYPEDARETIEELEVLAEYAGNLRLKRLCLTAAAVLTPTAALARAMASPTP